MNRNEGQDSEGGSGGGRQRGNRDREQNGNRTRSSYGGYSYCVGAGGSRTRNPNGRSRSRRSPVKPLFSSSMLYTRLPAFPASTSRVIYNRNPVDQPGLLGAPPELHQGYNFTSSIGARARRAGIKSTSPRPNDDKTNTSSSISPLQSPAEEIAGESIPEPDSALVAVPSIPSQSHAATMADTILQKFRSLECENCQQHFGYQSRRARARAESIFCSANCAESHLSDRNQNGAVELEPEPRLEKKTPPTPIVISAPGRPGSQASGPFHFHAPHNHNAINASSVALARAKASVPLLTPTPPQPSGPKPNNNNSADQKFVDIYSREGFRNPSTETVVPSSCLNLSESIDMSGLTMTCGSTNDLSSVGSRSLQTVSAGSDRLSLKQTVQPNSRQPKGPFATSGGDTVAPPADVANLADFVDEEIGDINSLTPVTPPASRAPVKPALEPIVRALPLRPPVEEPKFTSKSIPVMSCGKQNGVAAAKPLAPMSVDCVDRVPRNQNQESEQNRTTVSSASKTSNSVTIYPSKRLSKLSPDLKWGPSLAIGISLMMARVHSRSAIDIYVQNVEQSSRATAITEELFGAVQARSLPRNMVYSVGTVCVAPFMGDFYRAEIVRNNPANEMVQVFFSDFGNDEQVLKSDLLVLPSHLKAIPRLVYHCQWDLGATDEMNDDQKKAVYFKQIIEIKPIKELRPGQYVVGIGSYVPRTKIHISEDYACAESIYKVKTPLGQSISEGDTSTTGTSTSASQSATSTQSKPSEPKVMIFNLDLSPNINTNVELGIVYAWSLTRFMLGSSKDDDEREQMHRKLNSKTWKLEKYQGVPVVNELVIGVYDGELYRARVKEVEGDSAKVEFIDYGDSKAYKFEELFSFPVDLLQYPRFGQNVTLDTSKIKKLIQKPTPEIEALTYKIMTVEFTTMNKDRPDEFNAVFWLDPQKTFNEMFEDEKKASI